MEIVAGPGTAARFGNVCVWAGPGASELLVTFLVESARNVGASANGGARIADHIGAVLAGRDPEPGVPFASVGPGQSGTTILAHGAIQVWDGSRWLVHQPQPGWLRTEVAGPAPISVTAHGAVSLRPAPGSDLRGGVVPAGGFSLVPDPDPALATTLLPVSGTATAGRGGMRTGSAAGNGGMGAGGTPDVGGTPDGLTGQGGPPPTTVLPITPPAPGAAGPPAIDPTESAAPDRETTLVGATELADALRQIRQDRTETPPAATSPPADPPPAPPAPETAAVTAVIPAVPAFAPSDPEPTRARPPGSLDLDREARSPLPALRPVGQPEGPVPGQPVVAGVLCPAGHFNHPALHRCVRCRRPITAESGRVSGSRPSLGVLVIDDGAVYRLERSYLIGSDPSSDPTVTSGRVRPLTLESGPAVAASHAEIRLTGWGVSVIDRGSDGVTQVLLPGEKTWTALRPFMAHSLRPGGHIALGSRVVSLISPWPIDESIT